MDAPSREQLQHLGLVCRVEAMELDNVWFSFRMDPVFSGPVSKQQVHGNECSQHEEAMRSQAASSRQEEQASG